MKRLARDDGFSLMEMLVTLVVTGILFTTMMGSISSVLHWGGEVQERSVLQTEMRASVDRLAADLRQAYTGDATPLVESAGPTSIVFNSPDRSTPLHLRRIAYQVVGGELRRSVTPSTNVGGAPWTFPAQGPWETQVGSIVNTPVFAYRDSAGAVTTDPAQVKTVVITIMLATKAASTRRFTYRTSVTLRGAA
jgi:prepilin-type N-terminal cleavage/methylation domain-containing protein